jgi:hypothetical protein
VSKLPRYYRNLKNEMVFFFIGNSREGRDDIWVSKEMCEKNVWV